MIELLRLWWSMPKSVLVSVLIFVSVLNAAKSQIEMYATTLDSNETHVSAKGNVVVIYKEHYLSANEATFDRKHKQLELFGSITAMQGSIYHALGEYAKIDIDKEERLFAPFYLIDKGSQVWMSTAQAKGEGKDFSLNEGMVSGCNPNTPLWKIYFSSSDYNSQTRWMNVYNARLHIYDMPIFYFPYFGYSLDTRRRSGLLTPGFGISSDEGFFYEQPFYIAIDDQWDIELRPQIRTLRGKGVYANLRFVDSSVASGELTAGYFQERPEYAEEFDLAHEDHYGFGLNYENRAFLWDWFGLELKGQSGLYSDITWMNDVDYLNLANNDETQNTTSNQIDSKVNIFYNEEKNYIGAYFKYFLDLSKQSNAGTIQKVPIVQYHRYLESVLDDHFLYQLDMTFNNFQRAEGKTAMQSDITIPLTLQGVFLDDYLDLSYQANFYARQITFGGDASIYNPNIKYNSGLFGRYYHLMSAGTSLTRGYTTLAHTIGFELAYAKSESQYKSGYYEDYETLCAGDSGWNTDVCDYYNLSNVEDATQLKFSQYFFEDGEQLLYHKLAQRVSYEGGENRFGELENELELDLGLGLSYYNDTFYNHDLNKITKLLNSVRYNDEIVNVSINHFYEDIIKSRDEIKNSYFTADVWYQYSRKYRYFGKYAYDFENAVKKNMEIGFLYSKRCWDFGLRYVENNRPTLTNNESSSVYDKYIYFTIALKPMGGSELNYKMSNVLEGS
ncbi:MAG: LPS-assembly protein LptD [Campylobacterota bacterium]|nr:LPS-assembly protein LptD [Campylobacterota bacterium]